MRLRENLLAASAGLRAWSEEMQAATDELDRITTKAQLVSYTCVKEFQVKWRIQAQQNVNEPEKAANRFS